MLKIGLTGGIGCGKTTISNLFSELNVPVIDADDIAHDVVKIGQPALLEIKECFGDKHIQTDGSLNRQALRETIFTDPQQKQKLEAIVHPHVFAAMIEMMNQIDSPYCVLSIPLLFETDKTGFVDHVLVVDCPVELQIERVSRRDNLTEARVRSIIDSQVSRDFRITHADEIIDNTLTARELAEHVKKLHNFYLSISAS